MSSIIFITHNDFCKSSKIAEQEVCTSDVQVNYILPIDWSKEKEASKTRVNVLIRISKKFRCAYPFADDETGLISMSNHFVKTGMIEFISKEDLTPYKWSEIITLNRFLGKQINASFLVDMLINQIKQECIRSHIIARHNTEHQGCLSSFFSMAYDYDDRREIVYGAYYSGPYDCSGVQYAISLTDTMTEEKAKLKIEAFFKENVQVFKF